LVLAGGGLKHSGAYGITDDLAKKIEQNPVSVPDFHATVLAAMGIDPSKELMDGSRPVPITDGGKPVAALFS
jgi:arylsulfatase A-like enzyme